jgi:dihydrofolate synthase/folylpolyglutamate synthase
MTLNNLNDWLAYLETTIPSKDIVLGLDRIESVAEKRDLNSFSCPVITVAGTNGKGSTVAGITALLSNLGLRVGAYFSPHLLSFTERIQIEQSPISEDVLLASFEEIAYLRGEIPLTYFEFTTLAALQCFQWAELDVLVLEVGLGGRLDAVNCVSPDIAIITSIDYDHCDWLGTDLDSIAKEKAGICRPNIPFILGREAILSSIEEIAVSLNAKLLKSGKDFDWKDNSHEEWVYEGKILPRLLQSAFDESDLLAMVAVECLKDKFEWLENNREVVGAPLCVQMPGRFLKFSGAVTHIFDVAHNPHGARWLAKEVKRLAIPGRLLAVWSSFKDKDLQQIVAPFVDLVDEWFVGCLENSRHANLGLLTDTLVTQSADKISGFSDILSAYHAARRQSKPGDVILTFGSFETVATVLPAATALLIQKES